MQRDPNFNNTKLKQLVTDADTAYAVAENCRSFNMIIKKFKSRFKESGEHLVCLQAWALLCSEQFPPNANPSSGAQLHAVLENFVCKERADSLLLTYTVAMTAVLALRRLYAIAHDNVSAVLLGVDAFYNAHIRKKQ